MSDITSCQHDCRQDIFAGAVGRSVVGLIVALVLVLLLRGWLIHRTEMITRDGPQYVAAARAWSENPLSATRSYGFHPGYPALIAVMHKLLITMGLPDNEVTTWDRAGQMVSLIAALAVTVGIWIFAAIAFNWRVAWVTVIITSSGRKWAILGSDVLGDASAACCEIWGVVLALVTAQYLYSGRKCSILLAGAVGLCAGLGYLIRPEAIVILPLAICLGLVPTARPRHWGLRLASCASALLVAATLITPYILATGNLSNKLRALADGIIRPELSSTSYLLAMVTPPAWVHSLIQAMVRMPGLLSEQQHPLIGFIILGYLIWWVIQRLGLAKTTHKPLEPPKHECAVMMIGVLGIMATACVIRNATLGAISSRYLLLPALLLFPLAGAAVTRFADYVHLLMTKSNQNSRIGKIVLPLLVSLIVVPVFSHALKPLHSGEGSYREAGNFLKTIVGPEDVILAEDSRVAHYAQANGVQLGAPMNHVILRYVARDTGGSYVVLGEDLPGGFDRELRDLGQEPGFAELAVFGKGSKSRINPIHLYRIEHSQLRP